MNTRGGSRCWELWTFTSIFPRKGHHDPRMTRRVTGRGSQRHWRSQVLTARHMPRAGRRQAGRWAPQSSLCWWTSAQTLQPIWVRAAQGLGRDIEQFGGRKPYKAHDLACWLQVRKSAFCSLKHHPSTCLKASAFEVPMPLAFPPLILAWLALSHHLDLGPNAIFQRGFPWQSYIKGSLSPTVTFTGSWFISLPEMILLVHAIYSLDKAKCALTECQALVWGWGYDLSLTSHCPRRAFIPLVHTDKDK